ncbi:ABC transporter permease subunit [Agrobacterium tumefaciens]
MADTSTAGQDFARGRAVGPTRAKRGSRKLANTAMRLASPLAIIALWQLAAMTSLLSSRILAGPSEIISTAGRLVASGELINGLVVSFLRVLAGFSIALILGILLALISGLSRLGEAIIDPPIQMLKAMPFLGLLPLFILWFGIGEAPKIGLVAFGAIFPIYLTLHGGIRGIDKKLIELGQTLDLGTFGVIRHIVIPGALPSLLVAVRYGLSVAWLSLVVGEQINASSGIGYISARTRIIFCYLANRPPKCEDSRSDRRDGVPALYPMCL